jgi:hypothetical protein
MHWEGAGKNKHQDSEEPDILHKVGLVVYSSVRLEKVCFGKAVVDIDIAPTEVLPDYSKVEKP